MDYAELERLQVHEDGARLDITLARPEQRNALDYEMWDELDKVLRDVGERDGDIRVVVLTGAGSAFCAGVDFEAIGSSLEIERKRYPSFIRRWAGVADLFERIPQTTIAAINGPAVGAGLEIALACDLRVASTAASFCLPQMRMGIIPDAGGTSRLAKAVGPALAKDMVLSCRVIDAAEARLSGLVSRVVAPEQLVAEIDDLAGRVLSLPWPSAYFATVAIDVGPQLDPRRATDIEGIVDQVMLRHDDVRARVENFQVTKGLKGVPGRES